ncbi:MAG: nicotinamide riboside transporter PnuC [Bacteroidales bacterium]|jgi:nicotinamide mononucleotide transporter
MGELILEIFGTVTGLLYVWLEIKHRRSMWIVGIVMSVCYIVVFGVEALYASMSLYVYYLGMSLYGWFKWGKKKQQQEGLPEFRPEPKPGPRPEQKPGPRPEQKPEPRPETKSRLRTEHTEHTEHTERTPALKPVHMNASTAWLTAGLLAVVFGGVWAVLRFLTDHPAPAMDAAITTLNMVATWLLTRSILEQWLLLVVANILAVILYAHTGLWFTTGLYAVYLVAAVIGYISWRRKI